MIRRRDRIKGFFVQLRNRFLSEEADESDAPQDPEETSLESLESSIANPRSDSVDHVEMNVQEKPSEIDANWTIERAWRSHPRVSEVFAAYDLPNCDHCAVRFHETIAEAAEAYEIDLSAFMSSLQSIES